MRQKIAPDGPRIPGISAECAESEMLSLDLGSRTAAAGRAGLNRRLDGDCPSNIAQAAAKPASAGCGALHVWSAFALLMFARDGTVVLDGAAAAIRLLQPSGATVPADRGRQYILCRAMGTAAKPRSRSDRAAARGANAPRSRLETVPGHGSRPDRWWNDLAEPRCHRRMALLATTCLSAALQPNFFMGFYQLPVRDRRRAVRHGIVARSRTETTVVQGAYLVGCGAPLLSQSHCCSWVLCAGYLRG